MRNLNSDELEILDKVSFLLIVVVYFAVILSKNLQKSLAI